MNIEKIKNEINKSANPEKAKDLMRFFKTSEGKYGEGDIFLGIKVPLQRKIAKKYFKLDLEEIQGLLRSKIHEHRMIGLFILINKYSKSNKDEKRDIFDFYLKNTKNINNWDLVDLTAPKIVGHFIEEHGGNIKILYKLAKSDDLWEKRIAIISTAFFIRKGKFKDTLKIVKILLEDEHDLIHKAMGWMLREVGKRNQKILEDFLEKNIKKIPRITLRYAIEKFPKKKRKRYLRGEI